MLRRLAPRPEVMVTEVRCQFQVLEQISGSDLWSSFWASFMPPIRKPLGPDLAFSAPRSNNRQSETVIRIIREKPRVVPGSMPLSLCGAVCPLPDSSSNSARNPAWPEQHRRLKSLAQAPGRDFPSTLLLGCNSGIVPQNALYSPYLVPRSYSGVFMSWFA